MILRFLMSPHPPPPLPNFIQDYSAQARLLQGKQESLEKEMSELKQQLETEMKVFCCRVLLIHL